MGFLVTSNGWWVLLCVMCCGFICVENANTESVVLINGTSPIATTDEDFICATLDWWPPEKCDYGTCSWGQTSLLNLDLNNSIFLNAVKAFSPLKIRLGGTLQDKVIYQTKDNKEACFPFSSNSSEMFGFTQGCLPLARWDELNSFFNHSSALVIFGLNALRGKSIQPNKTATGLWDYSNSESLIRYTVEKGYSIYGWELGNELSGSGIGVGVAANSYASDTIVLHRLIQDIYKNNSMKPQIIAPGGFFDPDWFKQYLSNTVGSLNAITHHIYNLGPGSDEHLIDKILNPSVLDNGANVFRNLHDIVRTSPNSAVAWVGEAGGAYNSGRDKVTNAFVFSFWYLDQLGQASTYNTKTYCRQTLIGGNYGLLNTTTFVPNPDYYSALLWHRLMGTRVLSTNFTGTNMIRSYAHCTKRSQGITLLLINMDRNTSVETEVVFHGPHAVREEYHLTPLDGDIQSQTVMLNGKPLTVDPLMGGIIPDLKPVTVNSSEPVRVAPYSIVFVHMRYAVVQACL